MIRTVAETIELINFAEGDMLTLNDKLNIVKNEFIDILKLFPEAIERIETALIYGEIAGNTTGCWNPLLRKECGCLIFNIAKVKGDCFNDIKKQIIATNETKYYIEMSLDNRNYGNIAIEQFIMEIKAGDNIYNNPIQKLLYDWLQEYKSSFSTIDLNKYKYYVTKEVKLQDGNYTEKYHSKFNYDENTTYDNENIIIKNVVKEKING